MKQIVLRPRGVVHITLMIFYYIFMLGLSIPAFILLLTMPLTIMTSVYLIAGAILTVLLILLTRELILYKMVIKESKVWIAANRDFLLTRHKNMTIPFKGIKSIQYKFFVYPCPDGIKSVIILSYDNKRMRYINTMRFSKKQVDTIIQIIKERAEKLNGYKIEIKPEEIQGKIHVTKGNSNNV